MPRGRGGRRQGTPGKAYANRTDLHQPVRTAPSTSYGEAAASARAQQAMPLPQAPPIPTQAPTGPPPPLPGDRPFNRPTDRPNEPVTAGLPIGPGPGPSALTPAVDPVIETLRAAYRAFPNPDIARLIETAENRRAR